MLWLSLDCLSDALYLLDIAVHLHTGQCPSTPHARPLAPTPQAPTHTHSYTRSHVCTHRYVYLHTKTNMHKPV